MSQIADLVISADLAYNNDAGFLSRRRGLSHVIELPKSFNVLCALIACHQRTKTEEDARALVLVA